MTPLRKALIGVGAAVVLLAALPQVAAAQQSTVSPEEVPVGVPTSVTITLPANACTEPVLGVQAFPLNDIADARPTGGDGVDASVTTIDNIPALQWVFAAPLPAAEPVTVTLELAVAANISPGAPVLVPMRMLCGNDQVVELFNPGNAEGLLAPTFGVRAPENADLTANKANAGDGGLGPWLVVYAAAGLLLAAGIAYFFIKSLTQE